MHAPRTARPRTRGIPKRASRSGSARRHGPYAVGIAKKARTPPPPRKVQAPQRRDTKTASGKKLPSVPRWGLAAGGAVIVGVIVLIVLLAASGSSASLQKTMIAAGCTYRDVPPLPPKKDPTNYHADVPTLTSKVKWSTSPPSAGAHYGIWAVWGFYRSPVNPRQVVHNEEHGAVVIWWGPKVPSSTVDQLEAFYNQQPDGVFGTPYAGLGDRIALTAWTGDTSRYYRNHYYGIGHIATCAHFDQKAFAAFRSAYRGKGPEGVPLSSDEPGMGPQ
jgi:hypothetical protein